MARAIVSTSTSCLDQFNKPSNVHMLRMHINIYGQDYLDGLTITTPQIINMMIQDPKLLPDPSLPTEEEIINFFYDLVSKGYKEVLVVCLSSKLSKTYSLLQELTPLFANRMDIYLFDTRNVSYTEGMLALQASKMLSRGDSIPSIINELNIIRDNMTVLFVINDLRNMIRNKRISTPAGFIANLFDIKPLLDVNLKGEITPYEKIRHLDQAIDRMIELSIEEAKGKDAFIYMLSSGDEGLIQLVSQKLAQQGIHNVPVYPVATVTTGLLGYQGIGIGVVKQQSRLIFQ